MLPEEPVEDQADYTYYSHGLCDQAIQAQIFFLACANCQNHLFGTKKEN